MDDLPCSICVHRAIVVRDDISERLDLTSGHLGMSQPIFLAQMPRQFSDLQQTHRHGIAIHEICLE